LNVGTLWESRDVSDSPLIALARTIGSSPVHDWAQHALTVEGVAPMVQSAHILSIALVMASIVMLDLRVLGWASREQSVIEMTRRVSPFLVIALVILLLSGSVLVFVRPMRYFTNPFFLFKMAFLAAALVLACIQFAAYRRSASAALSMFGPAKMMAILSLLLWISVVVCGRWIAYYFPH
jgi:uncharacterized membrane protein SirB2